MAPPNRPVGLHRFMSLEFVSPLPANRLFFLGIVQNLPIVLSARAETVNFIQNINTRSVKDVKKHQDSDALIYFPQLTFAVVMTSDFPPDVRTLLLSSYSILPSAYSR